MKRSLLSYLAVSILLIQNAFSNELTNIALNKSTDQSSIGWSGSASHAVDGNTDGIYNHGTSTHTHKDRDAYSPWWQVDLGDHYAIDRIKLFNRTDCCIARLRDFYVFVSDAPFSDSDIPSSLAADSDVWHYFHAGPLSGTTLDIPADIEGRYVRVTLNHKEFLTLAEVQVWGTQSQSQSEDDSSSNLVDVEDPFETYEPEIINEFTHVEELIPLFDIGYEGEALVNIETGTPGNDMIYIEDNMPVDSRYGISEIGRESNDGVENGDDIIAIRSSSRNNIELNGAGGNDTLIGNQGEDRLYGGDGDDNLLGHDGNDNLYGGNGDDFIMPGRGYDNVNGDAGNDTICIEAAPGYKDSINGGNDDDTVNVCTIDSSQDWKIKFGSRGTVTLDDLLFNPIKHEGKIGGMHSIDAQIILSNADNSAGAYFTNVENLVVDSPYYLFKLDPSVSIDPANTYTVLVKIRPGFELKGDVSEIYVSTAGEYLQNVNPAALARGDIYVSTATGYIGDVTFPVKILVGDENSYYTEDTSVTLNVLPTLEGVLFAQTGNLLPGEFNERIYSEIRGTNFGGGSKVTEQTLNIMVNPLIDYARVKIDLWGKTLLDDNGTVLASGGTVTLTRQELSGLRLDSNGGQGYVKITLSGSLNGQTIQTQKLVELQGTHYFYKVNGYVEYAIDGNREDYDIARIGNALVVTPLDQRRGYDSAIRLNMVGIDHILFQNDVVHVDDFYKAIDVSHMLDGTDENSILVFSNLPPNVVINNSIELSNGTFIVLVREIPPSGEIYMDFATLENTPEEESPDQQFDNTANVEYEISLNKGQLEEGETDVLGRNARVQGYYNAKLAAEADFHHGYEVGDDGVRAEAKGYIGASAVVSAGGQYETANANLEVNAQLEAKAGVQYETQFVATDEGWGMGAKGEYGVTVSAKVGVMAESKVVPGTHSKVEGSAYATASVSGDANSNVSFEWRDAEHGKYGIDGDAGFSAGPKVGAVVYAEESIGGVGAAYGGGVSTGAHVAFAAKADATYDDRQVTILVGGKVAALIGVSGTVALRIDTTAVGKNAKAIGKGIVTAHEAYHKGMLTANDAIARGFLTAGEAIEDGYMAYNDAINLGLITVYDAIDEGYVTANEALVDGFISAEEAISNFDVDFNFIDRYFSNIDDIPVKKTVKKLVKKPWKKRKGFKL